MSGQRGLMSRDTSSMVELLIRSAMHYLRSYSFCCCTENTVTQHFQAQHSKVQKATASLASDL
eukprot:19119-Heterococcus_DN1.PRE.5